MKREKKFVTIRINKLRRDIRELENFIIYGKYPLRNCRQHFGGQGFSRVTGNRLAPVYERITGQEYPWTYYEPESHQERTRRIESARINRERRQELREILQRRLDDQQRQLNRRKCAVPEKKNRRQH